MRPASTPLDLPTPSRPPSILESTFAPNDPGNVPPQPRDPALEMFYFNRVEVSASPVHDAGVFVGRTVYDQPLDDTETTELNSILDWSL